MNSDMSSGDSYNGIFHDEIMNTMNLSSLFLTTTSSSDSKSSLPSDSEQAVDLTKYLDSESEDVQQEIVIPEQNNAINNIISPEQDNAVNNISPEQDTAAVNNIISPEQDNAVNNIISPEQDNAVNNIISHEQDNVVNNIISPEQDTAVNSIISPEQNNVVNNIISPEHGNVVNNIISPEHDNVVNNIISPEQDNAVDHFLLSPLRDNGINHFLLSPVSERGNMQNDIGYGPPLTSVNASLMAMVSRSIVDPLWVISPERSSWAMSLVQMETTVPPSPPKFNALNPDQHINKEHMSYLSPEDLECLYGSETSLEEQAKEKKAKADNVAGGNSVDSCVDVEIQEGPMSKELFEEKYPVAKTSRSTPDRKKFSLLLAARESRTRKPVGRPRGSKKQAAAAAATGQAGTSQFTLQPLCSTSNTETPSASRCVAVGQKRKFKCETVTSAQAQSVASPVFGVNFHDYVMSSLSSTSPSSVKSTTVMGPPRMTYRRIAPLDVVDKDKQSHHNQLEHSRRKKIANLFTNLRLKVPKILGDPKVSKVLILKEAVSHINHLKQTDNRQIAKVVREEQKQRLLTNQLQQLRAKLSSRLK